VRPLSIRWKLLLGYIMIDEVFATAIRMKEAEKPTPQQWCWYFFGSGISLVIVWYTTTVLGALLGKVISDDTTDVLGFSLPLIFTAIVVPMLKQRPALLAAVSAAAAGIIFAPMPNKLGLIVAAGVGIAAGVMAERVYGTAEVA
jgi:predicted branched-subunit amino acid permease